MFSIFVPDIMHDVEIGVLRGLVIHFLRILQSVDEKLLDELDRRSVYRPSS
jgi:hypothetical protein